jgi:hypothetical protein
MLLNDKKRKRNAASLHEMNSAFFKMWHALLDLLNYFCPMLL